MLLPRKLYLPPSKEWKEDCCSRFNLCFNESSEKDYDSIGNNLGKPYGISHIKGDGNCLFRSLAYLICGSETQHCKIRKIITDFIATNEAMQQSGLICDNPSIYLNKTKMSENGSWGTDVELSVASTVFQIPIYTYTKYGDRYTWLQFLPLVNGHDVNVSSSCALYIQHTSLCHYDAVISVENYQITEKDISAEKIDLTENTMVRNIFLNMILNAIFHGVDL